MRAGAVELLLPLLLLALAVHSLRTRGVRPTLLLFGGGALYALARELHIASRPRPMYVGHTLTLAGVPLLIVGGWVLHFALGLWLAETLPRRPARSRGRGILRGALITAAAMLVFALAGEPIGARLGWWSWNRHNVFELAWFAGIPINVLGGWMLTGGLFVFTYLLFVARHGGRWLALLALVASPWYFTAQGSRIPLAAGLLVAYALGMSWWMLSGERGE